MIPKQIKISFRRKVSYKMDPPVFENKLNFRCACPRKLNVKIDSSLDQFVFHGLDSEILHIGSFSKNIKGGDAEIFCVNV